MCRKTKNVNKCAFVSPLFLFLSLFIITTDARSQDFAIKNHEWTLEKAENNAGKDPERSMDQANEVIRMSSSPLLKAKAFMLLGKIWKKQKKYPDAADSYSKAYEMALKAKNAPATAEILRNLADIQRFTKHFDQATKNIDEAISLINSTDQYDELIDAYTVRGKIFKSAKNYEASLASFLAALEIAEKYGLENSKVDAYNKVSHAYKRLEQFDRAFEYKTKILEIFDTSENVNTAALVKHLGDLSELARKLGNNRNALQYALRGLNLLSNEDIPKVEQQILLNLTIIYRRLSVYDTSLEYAIRLRKSYQESGNTKGVVSADLQTALIYDHLERYDSAEEFYQRVLDIPVEKSQAKNHASANRGIAGVLHKLGDYQEALQYGEKARVIFLRIGSKSGIESINRLMGQIYASLGDVETALSTFEEALKQSREVGATWSEAFNLVLMGNLLLESNPDEAAAHAKEGLDIAEKSAAKHLILDGLDILMKIAYKKKQYKAAYDYSLYAKEVSEKINKENISKRIADLKIINDIYEKERKIELLERQAIINELELETRADRLQLLNEEKSLSALKLKRESYTQAFLLLVAIAFLAISYILFRRYKMTMKPQVA